MTENTYKVIYESRVIYGLGIQYTGLKENGKL
jgi:hypothetical protein